MRSRFLRYTAATLCSLVVLSAAGGCAPNHPISTVASAGARTSAYRTSKAVFPSWMATAADSGVDGTGVQGWGPGASGISVQYMYHPYADTIAEKVLSGMRRGRVIPVSDYTPSSFLSQGGGAHLILTFHDGISVSVDKAAWMAPRKDRASAPFPAGTVYYVNSTSISAGSVEKDSDKQVFCIVDKSGIIQSVWPKVFTALISMDPESEYPPAHPSAAWLHHLSADSATSYSVQGNDGTHLFRRTLSTRTTHSDINRLLDALMNATVVQPATVRSTEYGFRSWGRTHARSLAITFQNADTVHISAGYGVMKLNQPLRTDPNLFRVTSTSATYTTSVIVEDHSGVIEKAWTEVNQAAK